MNTLKIADFGSLNIDQFMFTPESEFTNAMAERINADVQHVVWKHMVDLELKRMNGNSAVIIHGSVQS